MYELNQLSKKTKKSKKTDCPNQFAHHCMFILVNFHARKALLTNIG